MTTLFPGSLDTTTELGSTYINDVAVTDQQRQVDATLRTNTKDAIMAVEARIGVTNSAVASSLSWATLSVGGTNNLGLRFAGSSAAWPGTTAEDGIFLVSTTGYPAYHRSGDPVGTFSYLTGISSMISMQGAYDGGASLTTSGTNLAYTFTTPDDFVLTMGAGSSLQIASGAASTITTGLLDVNYTVGVTAATAGNINVQNSTADLQFTGMDVTIDNAGDLTVPADQVNAYRAQIDQTGDGTGGDPSNGVAFFADSPTFTGSGAFQHIALSINTGYDWGVVSLSNSNLFFASAADETTTFNASHIPTGFTASEGVVFVKAKIGQTGTPLLNIETALKSGDLLGAYSCNIYTSTNNSDSEAMAATGDIRSIRIRNNTDSSDNATSTHYGVSIDYTYENNVGTYDGGGISYGVRLNMPEALDAGSAYHNNDGTFPNRWALYVDAGEATLRRTVFTGPANLAKALQYWDQNDGDQPFVALDGSYAGTATDNITDDIGTGSVVGPLNVKWTCRGLFRVEVVSGGGSLPAGDYWIPLYEAI